MDRASAVRSFAMTNMLLEAELDSVEERYELDLGRKRSSRTKIETDYLDQFSAALRAEAKRMSKHYELFYCLEKSIRELITDVFEASGNDNWWEELVPEVVQTNVKKAIKREKELAVTLRSTDNIDYTNFGELGEIIKSNWNLFGGVAFTEIKAVERVMTNLNSLRNPIAHCSPLAEDEVVRLNLSLRDWFRIVA